MGGYWPRLLCTKRRGQTGAKQGVREFLVPPVQPGNDGCQRMALGDQAGGRSDGTGLFYTCLQHALCGLQYLPVTKISQEKRLCIKIPLSIYKRYVTICTCVFLLQCDTHMNKVLRHDNKPENCGYKYWRCIHPYQLDPAPLDTHTHSHNHSQVTI